MNERRWRDPKRWWWLLSPALPLLVASHLLRFIESGQTRWLFLMSLFMYGVVPLMDALLGLDKGNPPESATAELAGSVWYRAIVVAYVPSQLAATGLGAWIAATLPLDGWQWLGLVLSVGGINGIAINTAHELGHKQPRWERALALVTLAPVAYGHFFVEHNRGHHRRVATREDPASARLGESFWAFLPRTVLGSLRSAWQLDRRQCLQAWALSLVLYAGLVAWLGLAVLPFLLVQAAYGISLLEVVNYIEHYGLLRSRGADGRVQRCGPEHSWNSDHRVSNLFLYQLQRHSDHHAHPGRRYQLLRHFDSSPQLPMGYAGMLLLAYLPPLWFRVMDPRVLAHYGGDRRRANLQII
ncbi:alkane 1-monooxygenase [Pelomonas sp. SE-A7]|uniref:alkane 1-monooxygenase n=1 Tax=Pelomonas sp. SE-A7 TaxID=3054953 RepID=UPI00259CEC62|nr:alkane 1-monooxygenase [Pelomonas sp. SE-A7]MDM4768086.1 alkane 1-monooxygenase [Pelomonas sp. SE-A7]